MCSDIFQSPSLFPYRVWATSSFRSAVGSFLANPFRHCAGPGLRWLSLDGRWLLNRSHKSRNECEISRLLFHCCFSAKLRRRSAHPETSDAGHESEGFRNARFIWRLTGGVVLMTISFFLTLC